MFKTLYTSGNSGKFNNYSVRNSFVFELQDAYEKGLLTSSQYVDLLNKRFLEPAGLRRAHVGFFSGKPKVYHPAVLRKKNGGELIKQCQD